jgi:hypothetical protein
MTPFCSMFVFTSEPIDPCSDGVGDSLRRGNFLLPGLYFALDWKRNH